MEGADVDIGDIGAMDSEDPGEEEDTENKSKPKLNKPKKVNNKPEEI
jgi:hypothetical protein